MILRILYYGVQTQILVTQSAGVAYRAGYDRTGRPKIYTVFNHGYGSAFCDVIEDVVDLTRVVYVFEECVVGIAASYGF